MPAAHWWINPTDESELGSLTPSEDAESSGMRTGIIVEVSASDRERLAAIVADRNAARKHVWRAHIVLVTADGCGTAEIGHQQDGSVALAMTEGVEGLLRDKTRPSRIPPLTAAVERLRHPRDSSSSADFLFCC